MEKRRVSHSRSGELVIDLIAAAIGLAALAATVWAAIEMAVN